MRAALITREFLPETRWGGIGTFYADLARSLVAAGVEVEVFTQALHHPLREPIEGALVHGCVPRWHAVGPRRGGALGGMSPRRLGSFAVALTVELTRCFEQRHAERPFDVVESHEHLGVGALLRGGRGRPRRIVRYHTAYDLLVGRGLEPWPRSPVIRWLEARALRAAEVRIAPSAFIERETRGHFPSIPRAEETIPLACRFPAAEASRLERKERLVVFVGRLQDRKQPVLAARVFARIAGGHQEWKLVFAGADSAGASSGWAACREALGPLAERSSFLGPLDAEGLAELFGRAALCIVPSSFESFGLVALEAMSFGCVPIVSAGHALEEVVGDAGCVAPVGDLEGFATHLGRLVTDHDERTVLAKRGIARARQEYGAAAILRRNLAVLERLAKQEPA